MRDFRFRSFSLETKKMQEWEFISEVRNLQKLFSLSHAVVMQFTGLKDINNVGIYEGDIILGYNYPHIVTYIDCAFYLIFEDSSIRLSRACGALKIIGNIYENPELLSNS
jgi:hypothetical protein